MSDIEPFYFQRKAEIGESKTTESFKLEAQKCRVKLARKCAKLKSEFWKVIPK